MARFGRTVRDSQGNTIPNATVKVYLAETLTFAAIFSDADLAVPIDQVASPLVNEDDGTYEFFVATGTYKIVVSHASLPSETYDNVDIGFVASPFYDVRVYGAVGDGVVDDSAAVQSAIDAAEAAGGGIVFFPEGKYLVAGLTADRVTLMGTIASNNDGVPYGATGSVLHVTDTVSPMVTIKGGVTFQGLSFFYPDQDGVAVTPVVYPPTIQASEDGNVTSLRVTDCKFINPYRAIVSDTVKVMGRCHIASTEAYAVKSFLELYKSPEIVHFTDVQITIGVYGAVANTGSRNLAIWTAENGEAIILDGHSDGFNWSQGIVHGYQVAISIKDTGATGFQAQLGSVQGVLFESRFPIRVVSPGALSDFMFDACGFGPLNKEDATDATPISFDWQSTGDGVSLVFSGCNFKLSNGKHVSITSTGLRHIVFEGCSFNNWARATGLAVATPAIYVNDAGVAITISGCSFRGQASAVDPAIQFDTVSRAVVNGCTFIDTAGPIIINGAGTYLITGCLDVGTTGGAKGVAVTSWTGVNLRGTGNNRWTTMADYPSFEAARNWGSIAAAGTEVWTLTSAEWPALTGSAALRDAVQVGVPDLAAVSGEGLVFQAYLSSSGGIICKVIAHNPTGSAIDMGNITHRLTLRPRD